VTLHLLAEVCEADHRGRTTDDANAPAIPYLNDFYQRIEELELANAAPEPVVQGRHLLERGYTAGPKLGQMLQRCFDYQLESGCEDVEIILAHLEL
jgi:tRNA nucleotidyltransferase (CCA-adding enzyme)